MMIKSSKKRNISEIGSECERKFQEWLDNNFISFIRVDQEPQTYARQFRGHVKRPDYKIIITDIGNIFVDAKSREMYSNFATFVIDESDIVMLSNFQKDCNTPVWLALSSKSFAYKTWFWISINDILLKLKPRLSSKSNDSFFAIPVDKCKLLGSNDGLNRLIEKHEISTPAFRNSM